ncbi:MAG: hypothetical protein AB1500_12415 [Bacillota bacterium]
MKKTTIICIIAVLAMAAMGFGYAKWSDTVTATVVAQSGELAWGWVAGSFMDHEYAGGADATCDLGLKNPRMCPEGKNVGSTTGTFSDTNGDSVLDLLTVTVENGYPCYFNEISGRVENFGTIPAIIQKAKLYWMNNEFVIDSYKVYWLGKDGTIVLYTSDLDVQNVVGGNWVLEFRFGDNVGAQLHTGDQAEESFEFHVLQAAEQNTTYTFGLSVEAVQWNESPI